MSRVPYLSREDLSAADQSAFDRISGPRGGQLAKVFSLALNSPEAAARIGELGAYVRFESEVSPDVREIAILATSREMNCQYEFTHHVPLARQAGVREEVIEAIKIRSTRKLIPQESVFIDYAKKVLKNEVNDATSSGVEHLVGRKGLVDITVVISYYAMLAHVMEALGVELEEGLEPLMPKAAAD